MAEVLTGDWQIEIASDPVILIGPGQPYRLLDDGFNPLDLPSVETSDRPLLGRHGLRSGPSYLRRRSLLIQFDVRATSTVAFAEAVNNFLRATRNPDAEFPVIFQIPGVGNNRPVRVLAKPVRRNIEVNRGYQQGLASGIIEFACTDPRLYSDDVLSASTVLPVTEEGFSFPFSFPFAFGAVSSGGSLNLTNEGSFPTPVVFRIDGPVESPRIENITTGKFIELDLELTEGQYLLVITGPDHPKVLLNGEQSRMSALVSGSRFFDLEPGSNNVTFNAATDGNGRITATYRHAFI